MSVHVAIDDLVEQRVRAWIDVGDRITPIYDLSTSNDNNENSGENKQKMDSSQNFGDPINTFWSTCQIHTLNSSVKSIEADIREIKSDIRSILDCLNKPKKSAVAASTSKNRTNRIDVGKGTYQSPVHHPSTIKVITSDSSKPGIFGTATSDSSKRGIFGTTTKNDSNKPGIFGTATSNASKPNLFGTATSSDSSKPNLFGTATSSDFNKPSLFGTPSISDSSKPSFFGTASTSDSNKPSLFATATTNRPSMSDENTIRESGVLDVGRGTIVTEFDAVNFPQDIRPDGSTKDASKSTLDSEKTPNFFGDGTRKESYQRDNHGISEDLSGGIAAVTDPEKEEVSRVATGSSCGSSQHDTNLASSRDGMVIDEDQQLFSERVTLSYLNAHGNLKLLGRGNLRVIYDRNLFGARLRLTTDDGDRVCDHIICRRYYVKKACNKENTCQWTARDLSSEPPITRTFHARFSTESAVQEFSEMFEKGLRWAAKAGIDEMAEGDTQQHRTLPKSVVS